jgi:phosphoglycerate kinase
MALENKTVFLRADLNVPLSKRTIVNDFKLQASRPTLDFLLQKRAKIVLATHLGRPKNAEDELSTKNLTNWFKQHGYIVTFAKNPQEAAQKVHRLKKGFILLENLRFFPGEKDQSSEFAKELKECGEIYVNDAFGTLHRNDTSITSLPELYEKKDKTIGFLVEKEIKHLQTLTNKPEKPYVVILGGGKVSTKLPFIKAMLHKADKILLCPALVFTLLKALGKPVGKSLVDPAQFEAMKELWQLSNSSQIIQLPTDYQIALNSPEGNISLTADDEIPDNALGTAIGPKSIINFGEIIKQAKTIFFNAAMGFANRPETTQATNLLLQTLAKSDAYTVVGGGDSVSAAFAAGVAGNINFLSTGGGATLAYLSGEKLPGLIAIGD